MVWASRRRLYPQITAFGGQQIAYLPEEPSQHGRGKHREAGRNVAFREHRPWPSVPQEFSDLDQSVSCAARPHENEQEPELIEEVAAQNNAGPLRPRGPALRFPQAEPPRPLSPGSMTHRGRRFTSSHCSRFSPRYTPKAAAGIQYIFKRKRPECRIAGAGVPWNTPVSRPR